MKTSPQARQVTLLTEEWFYTYQQKSGLGDDIAYLLEVSIATILAPKVNAADWTSNMPIAEELVLVQFIIILKIKVADLAIVMILFLVEKESCSVLKTLGAAFEATRNWLFPTCGCGAFGARLSGSV